MKITKSQLRKIIKEEISKVLVEEERLEPKEYIERIEDMGASVVWDLLYAAKNDTDVMRYLPAHLTPEYAQNTLLDLGDLLEVTGEDWDELAQKIATAVPRKPLPGGRLRR
tara:strand:+ start:731 stop:1063 length:333 start_codon:yes stop_codon:yes gene_type:complete